MACLRTCARGSLPLQLVLALAAPAGAAPVPADELSLLNGADAFERLCTECHRWDPAARYDPLYDDDPELPTAPPLPVAPAPRPIDWPEWAEEPLPEHLQPPRDDSFEGAILKDMLGAIDEVYGDEGAPGEADAAALEDPGVDTYGEDLSAPGAPDLSDPDAYRYGIEEDDLYRSIAEGIGVDMPGFLDELGGEEAVWDVVNYIRSLWDEDGDY